MADESLHLSATDAASSNARETPWFDELATGTGLAASLDPALRDALLIATAERAEESSNKAPIDAQTVLEGRRRAAREATERASAADAALRLSASIDRAERRSARDWLILVVSVILSVTVLVPWLLGRFMLRDGFLRPTGSGVFDGDARDQGQYFLTDWTIGCVVVLVLAAAIVLLGSWRRRVGRVIAALIVAALAFAWLFPASVSLWNEDESKTVAVLADGPYPFGSHYATCGSESFDITNASGVALHYDVFTASAGAVSGCNRLELYQGWTPVESMTLPSGESIQSGGLFVGIGNAAETYSFTGKSLNDSGVVFPTTKNDLVGFTLSNIAKPWRVAGGGSDVFSFANLVVAEVGLGKAGGYLRAVRPRDGKTVWKAACPHGSGYMESSPQVDDAKKVIDIQCHGHGGRTVSKTGAVRR